MVRMAVDVVLLPDEAMTQRSIDVNAELVGQGSSKIVLNKEDCLPHISLAMGCIDEEDIGEIGQILEKLAGESGLRDLKVVEIVVSSNWVSEKVSVLRVEATRELQQLHEQIMLRIEPYLRGEAGREMIPGEEVSESTLQWINNYREKASFENFLPHITLGYGDAGELESSIEFSVERLALCGLGNHCTCRKILASVEVGGGQ